MRNRNAYYRFKCLLLLAIAWAFFPSAHLCSASHVVVVTSPKTISDVKQYAELAARFYGIDVLEISVPMASDSLKSALVDPDTIGIIISGDALVTLRRETLIHMLEGRKGQIIPVLLADLGPELNKTSITEWTNNQLNDIVSKRFSSIATVHIGRIAEVSAELTNQVLPIFSEERIVLQTAQTANSLPMMEVVDGSGHFPVFIEDESQKFPFFFMARTPSGILPDSKSLSYLPDAFSQWAAQFLMYIRFAAADRSWHFPRQFANFTVDDPWLIEPYGEMSYTGLLQEMEKHNYHTTVAFIPWNFDRSRANVVNLIRNHPDRFSICVHGDDHSHAEFALETPRSVYTKARREEDDFRIRQARARMDEFTRLTGIPYDRVWIFPHVIGPQPVLSLLKHNGFLATTNSEAVPYGTCPTADPLFRFRNVTLAFENFASIRRFPAGPGLPSSFLAIQLFLGNPILLYSHQDYFSAGNGAFNQLAGEINRLNPRTTWTNLGEIALHSYLLKRRDDGDYDVHAYSGEIVLANATPQAHWFYISKEVNPESAVDSILVDGKPTTCNKIGTQISVAIKIPAAGSRRIVLDGEIVQAPESVEIAKNRSRGTILRYVSDFRDLIVSRNRIGRMIIDFYYEKIDPEKVGGRGRLYAIVTIPLLMASSIGFFVWWKKKQFVS